MSNLISLCNSCHDFVEINDFDFNLDNNNIKIISKVKDWHKWVYGDYTKPTERR